MFKSDYLNKNEIDPIKITNQLTKVELQSRNLEDNVGILITNESENPNYLTTNDLLTIEEISNANFNTNSTLSKVKSIQKTQYVSRNIEEKNLENKKSKENNVSLLKISNVNTNELMPFSIYNEKSFICNKFTNTRSLNISDLKDCSTRTRITSAVNTNTNTNFNETLNPSRIDALKSFKKVKDKKSDLSSINSSFYNKANLLDNDEKIQMKIRKKIKKQLILDKEENKLREKKKSVIIYKNVHDIVENYKKKEDLLKYNKFKNFETESYNLPLISDILPFK